jgi:hypothetical protein
MDHEWVPALDVNVMGSVRYVRTNPSQFRHVMLQLDIGLLSQAGISTRLGEPRRLTSRNMTKNNQ